MVDDKKVELEFVADTQGVDEGFRKVDRGLDELDQKVSKASDATRSFFAVFSGSLVAGAVTELARNIVGAIGQIPEALSRGSAIDDIHQTFESLSQEAGAVGDVFIEKLGGALSNTIPKVELMQKANELLLGGLKPDQIELVAKAARSLGEATGVSASQGMDQLSDSLLRGNDRALKTLGIVVDNEAAMYKYAKSVGKLTEDLSEQEKVEAIRAASLEALAANTERLGAVTDDTGDMIDQISSALQNQKDEALRSVSANEDLQAALASIRDRIKEVDFVPLIEGLTQIISLASQAAIEIVKFTNGTSALDKFAGKFDSSFKVVDEDLKNVIETLSVGTVDAVKKAEVQFNDLVKRINQAGISTALSAAISDDMKFVQAQIEDVKKQYGLLGKEIPKVTTEQNKLTGSLNAGAFSAKKAEQAAKEHEAAEKKRAQEIEKANEALYKTFIESQRYSDILEKLRTGTISSAQADDLLNTAYSELGAATKEAAVAQETLRLALERVGKGASITQDDLSSLASEAQKTVDVLSGLSTKADSSNSENGGFLTGLLGNFTGGSGSADMDFAKLAGQELGSAILDGISIALSGEELSKQQIGQKIGSGLGGAIGAYFGGPAGAQIGSMLGGSIGEGLVDAFGTRDTQGAVRDALDRLFVDALKDNPLLAIIDGQLQKITDLDFFRGTDKFNTGAFDDVLQSLPAQLQEAFQGVATGFSEVFGQGSELSTQLAAILADNLGGSLNNLQLLVESTGKSFEELKEATVEAFLDGKLSALEAQSALNGIAQISQKGIPDGLGLVSTAFGNLVAAGTKGGRALIDALQDIGYEAKELHQTDLAQAQASIAATGKYSADEIKQVFDALAAQGITTVDQLTNATTEELLPVLAQLENTSFPFAEATKDVAAYIDAVDRIPSQKDVQLNIRVNYQNSEDQRVVSDLAGRGAIGQGNATL